MHDQSASAQAPYRMCTVPALYGHELLVTQNTASLYVAAVLLPGPACPTVRAMARAGGTADMAHRMYLDYAQHELCLATASFPLPTASLVQLAEFFGVPVTDDLAYLA